MPGITFPNIWDGAAVTGRSVIVHGKADTGPGMGSVIVWAKSHRFPAQRFPLVEGWFKALLFLEEGSNQFTFETDMPNAAPLKQDLTIRYLPVKEDPPVHFCLMVAKDSPETFDSPPEKIKFEGNGLGTAVKKMRMASYMMGAFCQEQMNRNNFGLRTFRPYEENEFDTVSNREQVSRPTTHVHVVRMNKTLAEIRDPDVAQQNSNGKRQGDLFGMAHEALLQYGGPFKGDGDFVQAACIFLDTHWDGNLVLGHAALGGGFNQFKLAIFGSHTLHAWPTCIEDLPRSFLDSTRTDTRYVANDAGQSGTHWEALNVGMGAFQHEVGHLLGCPHEPDGVMLRGYLNWNRSFMALEGWSQRENKVACRCATPDTEDYWNRLDIMRFLHHPSFRLPGEPELPEKKPMAYPLAGGIAAHAEFGIYMIDIHVDGNSRAHFEYEPMVQEVQLSCQDIQNALSNEFKGKSVELHIHSPPMGQLNIDNLDEFLRDGAKNGLCMSSVVGQKNGNEVEAVIPPGDPVVCVRVHAGQGLDGFEFLLRSGQSVLFGKRGGSPYDVPIEPGDEFVGLAVRSGAWVDAGGVITKNKRSPLWGGSGGGPVDLIPPRGHRFAGLHGWYWQWTNGLALLYES